MSRDVRTLVGTVLALFAMWFIVCHECGCRPTPVLAPTIENAAAVAQYEALLDDCRRQGRAAGSYAVYETCADAVDSHLCAQHRLRCPEDR
jgi:hypothetical protein